MVMYFRKSFTEKSRKYNECAGILSAYCMLASLINFLSPIIGGEWVKWDALPDQLMWKHPHLRVSILISCNRVFEKCVTVLVLSGGAVNSSSFLHLPYTAHSLTAAAVLLMDACVNKSGHREQSHGNHCDACVVRNSSLHILAGQLDVFLQPFVTLAERGLSSCNTVECVWSSQV